MKTLIFNGSPRKNGDTVSLLNVLNEKLQGEVKVINAYFADIKPCVDCRFCRKNDGCAIKDEMQEIYEYIADCDNVVIASPIYFSQPTGKLLDVASRFQTYFSSAFFRKKKPDIKAKKGGVILVGGGDGKPESAYETSVSILHLLNASKVFPLVCSHGTDSVPAISDEKAVSDAIKLAEFLNGEK